MNMNINLDLEKISDAIVCEHNKETIFEFIKDLDFKMKNWRFTEALYEHFKNKMEKKNDSRTES